MSGTPFPVYHVWGAGVLWMYLVPLSFVPGAVWCSISHVCDVHCNVRIEELLIIYSMLAVAVPTEMDTLEKVCRSYHHHMHNDVTISLAHSTVKA
jgi:hypothetical protein